ncbi:MAG: transglycosylase domain-containing protein [Rhodospirillales bacterium]|nr:transglycosylase domain-containing protein [Rhodospirillales bacterium]
MSWDRVLAGMLLAGVAGVAIWGVSIELEASPIQSRLFSKLASNFSYTVEPGPNADARFPEFGPYDERLGYAHIPSFITSLTEAGFVVSDQARLSSALTDFIDYGGFAVFPEKSQAGLTLYDSTGEILYLSRHPERVFASFDSIPPFIVDALLFIENRELLDDRYPMRNPAVEWDRFAAAAANVVTGHLESGGKRFGGSTLATQIEKYRHSPEGRTNGIEDKLRQITSASLRAYSGGPITAPARQHIVVDYINSTPLSARAGFGEVIGIGDGLWAWYGTDLDEAVRVLNGPNRSRAEKLRAATIYKQVVSLLIAQRRPSYYLLQGHEDLEQLIDTYLRLMAADGIISAEMRDAAIAAPLAFRHDQPPPAEASFIDRKATTAMRAHILSLIGVPQFYELDRLDLRAESTLDAATQRGVINVLRQVTDDDQAEKLGLIGKRLLQKGEASGVAYSFTLYERGSGANYLRVQADTLDRPLDLNEGGKFDLGSTAKLRTLVTYLQIIAKLHEKFATMSRAELTGAAADADDPLTRWAAQYLAESGDRRLQPMVDAAMDRTYSASPGEAFFTGHGLHVFSNFDKKSNGLVMSLTDALRNSVNLVFIRLMRDIIRYYQALGPEPLRDVLADPDHPERGAYLERFADMEGKAYLDRFYRRYRNRTPDEALALLSKRARPTPYRQATIFRSVRPDADVSEFRTFIKQRLPDADLDNDEILRLYNRYGPNKFNLHDRGYIARVHPLELWLVNYLQKQPDVTRNEVIAASTDTRQEVYAWLFKAKRKGVKDSRIRIMLEDEAFEKLHEAWAQVGYPFATLVPSLATAIGSSADRPAALAELVGIILNDGVRQPTVRIKSVHLAEGTPYEAHLVRPGEAGEQLFPAEVAVALRRALANVVANGTAKRAYGAFVDANGRQLPCGGKTGTGDETFGRGSGRSKEVGRAAAFAFYIGDRFFGVITAHVPGERAGRYTFTSALPTQVLKVLAPSLEPLITRPVQRPDGVQVIAKADHAVP